MANKIIISRAFSKELAEHSRQVQKGVNAIYGKLMQPEGVNGLNLETIKGASSTSIKSVRLNDNFRVVLHQDKKGNFTFLYVGTHEKAYDWATRNRFEVNAFTGELQIYVVDIPEVKEAQAQLTSWRRRGLSQRTLRTPTCFVLAFRRLRYRSFVP